MPPISVRNPPDGVHRALKRSAIEHGRSTEAEARAILAEAVLPPAEERMGSALRSG
jgi:plasmid stability protein